MAFCTECGHELRPGVRFCEECGGSVATPGVPTVRRTPTPEAVVPLQPSAPMQPPQPAQPAQRAQRAQPAQPRKRLPRTLVAALVVLVVGGGAALGALVEINQPDETETVVIEGSR